MTPIIPIREIPRGTLVRSETTTVFGRIYRLYLALLEKTSIAAMPYTPTIPLVESIRRRYWAQIRIYNEESLKQEIVLVNRASFIHRLVAWGLSQSRVEIALQEDRILEEIVDRKAKQILRLLPPELIAKPPVRAALLYINACRGEYTRAFTEMASSAKIEVQICEGVSVVFKAPEASYLVCKDYKIDWRSQPRLLCHERSLTESRIFHPSEVTLVNEYLIRKQEEFERLLKDRSFPYLCKLDLPTHSDRVEVVFMSPYSAIVESPKILGKGGMKGAVHKAVDVFSGKEMALTRMNFSTAELESQKAELFFREVDMHRELQSVPGVLTLVSSIECPSVEDAHQYLVYTELCNLGNLTENILRPRFFSQSDRYEVAKQLIDLLTNLHKIGRIHCDLKTDNLLLKHSEEARLTVVIGDLGSMAKKTEAEWIKRAPRTWRYSSPSLARMKKEGKEFTEEVAGCAEDVWSCGIILLQLFSRKMTLPWLKNSGIPYSEMSFRNPLFVDYMAALPPISLEGIYLGNPEELIPHRGAAGYLEAVSSRLDTALRRLIEYMLEVDVSKRPSMQRVQRFYENNVMPLVPRG